MFKNASLLFNISLHYSLFHALNPEDIKYIHTYIYIHIYTQENMAHVEWSKIDNQPNMFIVFLILHTIDNAISAELKETERWKRKQSLIFMNIIFL